MTTIIPTQTVAPWPLARRVASGFAQPGGPPMTARLIEGAAVDDASRVVELAPGLGTTSAALLARNPRSWTGVEPDQSAAAHLRRAHGGARRTVVGAPVTATGLEEGGASVVVADSLLSTLTAGPRAEAVAEAARLLRAGGRLAVHDIAPAPGAGGISQARDDLGGIGIALLAVEEWRASMEAAGLVVVGSLLGKLDLPAPSELMRRAGPRTALGVTKAIAADSEVRAHALAGRELLVRHSLALRSVVVVAELPLILGMRRPRR